jgi:hypothetical protein
MVGCRKEGADAQGGRGWPARGEEGVGRRVQRKGSADGALFEPGPGGARVELGLPILPITASRAMASTRPTMGNGEMEKHPQPNQACPRPNWASDTSQTYL